MKNYTHVKALGLKLSKIEKLEYVIYKQGNIYNFSTKKWAERQEIEYLEVLQGF